MSSRVERRRRLLYRAMVSVHHCELRPYGPFFADPDQAQKVAKWWCEKSAKESTPAMAVVQSFYPDELPEGMQ